MHRNAWIVYCLDKCRQLNIVCPLRRNRYERLALCAEKLSVFQRNRHLVEGWKRKKATKPLKLSLSLSFSCKLQLHLHIPICPALDGYNFTLGGVTKSKKNCQESSVGRDTCCCAVWPDWEHWTKRGPTPSCCPLSSTCAHTHTHAHKTDKQYMWLNKNVLSYSSFNNSFSQESFNTLLLENPASKEQSAMFR